MNPFEAIAKLPWKTDFPVERCTEEQGDERRGSKWLLCVVQCIKSPWYVSTTVLYPVILANGRYAWEDGAGDYLVFHEGDVEACEMDCVVAWTEVP